MKTWTCTTFTGHYPVGTALVVTADNIDIAIDLVEKELAQQFHLIDNPNLKEPVMNNELRWKKYHPLSDKNAFICLVDHMGDDSSIVQAARVSYGKDEQGLNSYNPIPTPHGYNQNTYWNEVREYEIKEKELEEIKKKDRQLIRYLMNHSHTTPFEMVEIKFMVQVPMDCWRQWIRHRTASVNEYSTRYTEALDMQQTTLPEEWRLQATDNKQGSSGYLEEWPKGSAVRSEYRADDQGLPEHIYHVTLPDGSVCLSEHKTPQKHLCDTEHNLQRFSKAVYQERLALGIAKEQARKDLPLSTYTRAYWKCDLHNIFNFLRLRMDSHAQLEIRQFANCMFEIVKQICPVACEAFEDYVLHAKKFSRMEMEVIRGLLAVRNNEVWGCEDNAPKPSSMTDREWKEFLNKLS